MTSDELMKEVEELKAKAAQHEKDQTDAKATEAVLRDKLGQLEARLRTDLGIESWDEARKLLPHYAGKAREALENAVALAKEAGIDV